MIRGKLKQDIYDTNYDIEKLNSYSSQLQKEFDDIEAILNHSQNTAEETKCLKSKLSTNRFLQEQINILLSVFSYRDEICILFEKISDGIPLLCQKKR